MAWRDTSGVMWLRRNRRPKKMLAAIIWIDRNSFVLFLRHRRSWRRFQLASEARANGQWHAGRTFHRCQYTIRHDLSLTGFADAKIALENVQTNSSPKYNAKIDYSVLHWMRFRSMTFIQVHNYARAVLSLTKQRQPTTAKKTK